MKLVFERSLPGFVNNYLQDCTIPADFSSVRAQKPSLPEVPESELARHYTTLASQTRGVNGGFYPLGSCTMKYNPKVNEVACRLPGLAETHRLPFDLPEAENELISGFMTEYGGIKFALYFIAEYTAMVVNSAIVTTVFLGGWKWPAVISDLHPLAGVALFVAKVLLVLFLYVWVRASTPRVRFDKFMRFAWKFMLPLALANLLVTAAVVALL